MSALQPRTRSGRGLGCVESLRWDPRNAAHPAHTLIGAGATPPRASLADLVFIPPGFAFADQEHTQACVGWTVTQLVHVRMRAMGVAPVTPSPGAVYYAARARRYGWDAIWDGGCNPHEAFAATRELGVVPYATWPHDPHHVNDGPPPDCYRCAADHAWLRYRWVLTGGAARTAEIVALLASRRPVGVALQVDQSLEEWQAGDSPWTRTGPVLGGHMVTIVGYDTTASGERVFIAANSWGDTGDHGFVLLSQRVIESDETTYVCTVDLDPEALA